MKIIVINGHAESGKSTFVRMCVNYPEVDVYEVSMVDAAKHMAKLIGWEETTKSPRDRKFLSDLKDLIDTYNNGSYNYVKEKIKSILSFHNADDEIVLFIHAREPKDITQIVNDFNAKTLVIRRKDVEGQIASNHADANWWQYTYDYAVNNNGDLDDLEQNSKDFMRHILKEDWRYINERNN